MKDPQKEQARLVPPYVPFKTFLSFIDRLKNTAIPPHIDRTVIPTMSSQIQSQLYSGLRFLRLIDGKEIATDKLRSLVKAYGTPEWKGTLSGVIGESYDNVWQDLDTDNATAGQLLEKFRVLGVEGQMLEKAVRFFLSAQDEAGMPYSPHFKTRGAMIVRQKANRDSGARKTNVATSAKQTDEDEPQVPEGRFQIPFGIIDQEGYVMLSKSITVEQWNRIAEYVKFVVGLRPHNVRAQMKTEKKNEW